MPFNLIQLKQKKVYNKNMIRHYPVMYRNILSKIFNLKLSRAIKIADCNFGFGGHSHHILKTFPNAFIQGFDLDPKVIQYYTNNFHNQLSQSQKKRLTITNDNFSSLGEKGVFNQYDIILADFGFNNFHISTSRGFSWLQNQELDMRYSQKFQPCKDLIQRSSLLQLRQIIQKFTDIKESKFVAEAIFNKKPIKTTFDLRDSIVGCFQKQKQKKVAQVFQAFRIATNRQLQDIQKLCRILQNKLTRNGMALLITFHSIQRDVVYNKIKQNSIIFQKIQIQSPLDVEVNQNSMSKSAKLLSFKKKN